MYENKPTRDDLIAFDELISRRTEKGYVSDSLMEALHPINPETGLPSLPDGYLWRVFKHYENYHVALIWRSETTETVPTFWGFLTGKTRERVVVKERQLETWRVKSDFTDPVVAVYSAATSLLSYMAGRISEEVANPDLSAFVGDYPPKNIHTAED